MTTSDLHRGPVRAVRLPHVLARELDKVAPAVGGYGKAIEMLATEQQLPHDWFRKNTGDALGVSESTRITFRLSLRTERALRAWGGRRPLSRIVRHLILYSFTDGLDAQTQPIPPPVPVAPTRLPAIPVDTPSRSKDAWSWSGVTAGRMRFPLGSPRLRVRKALRGSQ